MCPRKEEEVKDDGTEGGREGRKDEGIPDAPLLRRSQDSERVYGKPKVGATVTFCLMCHSLMNNV